jgi:hypothetical protein
LKAIVYKKTAAASLAPSGMVNPARRIDVEIVHEEWRPVVGRFKDCGYEVSNYGRVRRTVDAQRWSSRGHAPLSGRLLAQRRSNRYTAVRLRKHGKQLIVRVHRLVAEAFLPNPENKLCINHKDANRENCHISNLEWCTQKENNAHSRLFYGRVKKPRTPQKRLTLKEQLLIVRRRVRGTSAVSLAVEFGVTTETIRRTVARANEWSVAFQGN